MAWTSDDTLGERRVNFNRPEGQRLLQVALKAHTASPEELTKLVAAEQDTYRGVRWEIERQWGGDPDEPPVAERWEAEQDYEAICDAISNPQAYLRQAREQGLLPAAEPGGEGMPPRADADKAPEAPHMAPEQTTPPAAEPPSAEPSSWFERAKRALWFEKTKHIFRSQRPSKVCEKTSKPKRGEAEIDIEP